MIIKRIVLNNFFRFYGKQVVEMAISGDKNVTIMRGDNGTGKTTILNAFYWCFYGDVVEPLHIDRMLNDMTEKRLENGDSAEAFVEIEFKDKGIIYTIKRGQRFIKRGGKVSRTGQPNLSVLYADAIGNVKEVDDPETFFPSIIPKELRGFFFFDGERINRLAKIDGREEIQKAILDILGLTNLELISDDLLKIKAEYNKDLKKYIKGPDTELSDEFTRLIEEQEVLKKDIQKNKDELLIANENLENVNKQLMEHNLAAIRDKQSERKQIEDDLVKLNNRLAVNTKNHLAFISKNFKIYGIQKSFDTVSKLLEEKRKKGELPSDIKIQFVRDLLDREQCICGTALKHGSVEYNAVSELKKVAGRTELDDAYTRLASFINYYKEDNFYEDFYVYIKDANDINKEKEIREKRLKQISDDLKNYPEEKIRNLEDVRSSIRRDISKYHSIDGKLSYLLEMNNTNCLKMEAKIQDIKLGDKQAERIREYMNVVQSLGQINAEISDYFIKNTRENLDRKIKSVFAALSRKEYRVPILTEEFQLIVRSNVSDDREEILSTGEGQITSLAFIGSLVSYAREKAEGGLVSDFGGGDFPIVMDSPFGNLDEVHTANVAAGISELAEQVVIIVSDKQWRQEVEDNIMAKVGRMYVFSDGSFDAALNEGEYTAIKEVGV